MNPKNNSKISNKPKFIWFHPHPSINTENKNLDLLTIQATLMNPTNNSKTPNKFKSIWFHTHPSINTRYVSQNSTNTICITSFRKPNQTYKQIKQYAS